jgi:hypothetical protein
MKETCTPCLGEQDFTEMLSHPEKENGQRNNRWLNMNLEVSQNKILSCITEAFVVVL